MLPNALLGIRVVEWCEGIAGPFCGRLLAEMGAEVVKIEAPGGGDDARGWAPFPDGSDGAKAASGRFFYYNVGKKGITLRPETGRGRSLFRDLVRGADVLIEDRAPGFLDELGVGYGALSAINPGLVMTSITPFGQTGPYRGYRSYQLNNLHAGGEGWELVQRPGRPPVMTGGDSSESFCGLMGAIGTASALRRRRVTGRGNHVDLSRQEASMWPGRVELSAFPNEGITTRRRAGERTMGGVYQARDGYVEVQPFEERMWSGLVRAMGNPDWASDPRFKDRPTRSDHAEEIHGHIQSWTGGRDAMEVAEALQSNGCPAYPVMSTEQLAGSRHYRARGYFVDVEDRALGHLPLPSTPFGGAKPSYSAAPGLGEHTDEVLTGLGLSHDDIETLRREGVV